MSSSISTSSGLRDKPAYVAEMGRGLRAALPVMRVSCRSRCCSARRRRKKG